MHFTVLGICPASLDSCPTSLNYLQIYYNDRLCVVLSPMLDDCLMPMTHRLVVRNPSKFTSSSSQPADKLDLGMNTVNNFSSSTPCDSCVHKDQGRTTFITKWWFL